MLYRIFTLIFILILFGCTTDTTEQAERNNTKAEQSPASDSLTQNIGQSFARIDSSHGQTIYVPVYSHIYQRNHKTTFNLTTTLSIRNADLNRSFTLKKVLYYDSQGEIVKIYLEEPLSINPLASTSFVVEENDLRGGVGANFIVVWKSEEVVFPPIVEAVMISTSQQQGISFVSVGRVLENQSPDSLNSK